VATVRAEVSATRGTLDRVVFCCFDERAEGLHRAALSAAGSA
jgi:hypothetical protein